MGVQGGRGRGLGLAARAASSLVLETRCVPYVFEAFGQEKRGM